LHTPALRIGTHFLLTLETVVFLFHLLNTTSKPFSSLSTRLAHAARFGFFYKKNALYKFTVIIITEILRKTASSPNFFTEIGQSDAELWPKTIFKMAAVRHVKF